MTNISVRRSFYVISVVNVSSFAEMEMLPSKRSQVDNKNGSNGSKPTAQHKLPSLGIFDSVWVKNSSIFKFRKAIQIYLSTYMCLLAVIRRTFID